MSKNKSKDLTEQLRDAVRNCGKTLGELAKKTGIDKGALSRFINGHRGVSMEAMDALGQCLGLRIVAEGVEAANDDKPPKGERKSKAEPIPGKLLGTGVFRGNEAIDCLKRIPKGDALRERAYEIVSDWIKANE